MKATRTCSFDGCDRRHYALGFCRAHHAQFKRGCPLHPIAWSAMERFLDKVDRSGDCWLWTGSKKEFGYGTFWSDGRLWVSHRWLWQETRGPIAPGLELDHLCNVPSCVNPDHLEPVSPRVNNVIRSGSIAAVNARKTHCKHGHLFDAANTYVRPSDGGRICRACFSRYRKKAA